MFLRHCLEIDTNNELIVNLNLLGLEKSLEIYDWMDLLNVLE